MSQFFYSTDGTTRVGPIEHDALVNLARIGMLSPTTLIWREGYSDWTPAALTPELGAIFEEPTPDVVTASPAGAPDAPAAPAAISPPTIPGPIGPPKKTGADGMAIAAFVIGICGIVLAGCLNIFAVPLPIVGLILASLSKTPGGMRTAAFILSTVGLVLILILALVIFGA